MAVPTGWPGQLPSGVRSVRFFASGTATANFEDNAFLIGDVVDESQVDETNLGEAGGVLPVVIGTPERPAPPLGGGVGSPLDNPSPPPKQFVLTPSRAPSTIRIFNDGAGTLEFSFDGADPPATVHGRVLQGEALEYRNRYEVAISVRGAGLAFRIEAW